MAATAIFESLIDGFDAADWPIRVDTLPKSSEGFVYVFIVFCNGRQLPIYVGQTKRLAARMGDYEYAQFAACTDFRVGEAVRYFHNERDCGIQVRYRSSTHGLQDEYRIIRELQLLGFHLLNDLRAYDYHQTNADAERKIIRRFCNVIMPEAEVA
jgi:hypothetical protein